MFESRRQFIKQILPVVTLCSGILPTSLADILTFRNKFSPGNYQDTLTKTFGTVDFIETKKIKISRLPKTAENGALVPIIVDSDIKHVEKISILVEKNPSPLSAEFFLSPAVATHVSARLKMAKTCNVIVIIEAQGKFYRRSQAVKVTKGGCG